MTASCVTIATKEVVDHLRDRRTLVSLALYALMGPAVVFVISFSHLARQERTPAVILGMLSVFGLVSAFAGGAQMALDMMAGERERHSLLPLLTTAVTRGDIVIGKWLAVSFFGVIALGVNLSATVIVLASRLPATLIGHAAALVVWAILGLAPLAVLGAAVELLIAGMSRTTKEAATSMMFAVFIPMCVGMFLTFFPVTTTWWTAVPIAGQQIAIQAAIVGMPFSVMHSMGLAAVTLVTASAPLLMTERMLRRDDVCRG